MIVFTNKLLYNSIVWLYIIGDKMKQKINVLIIAIIAVAILITSFMFAINYRKESVSYFYDSGYIISNLYEDGANNVNKLYFENETSYKKYDDTYSFTNSEGEKVNVNEESFVHYSSGSIMSLKKGVAIDLDDIDSKLISYYSVFEGSLLTKKNEVYEIENLNDTISFSKLMFKISNNKYLIGAPKIIISFSDDQTVDMEDYAEIEYVNENVIRIYNDKVNYQTIASDLYLMIDDVKVDLEYKTISKKNIEYLTMADMVINSDDNIEVLPQKPEIIVPEENNNGNNNGGGNNNNQGNNPGGEIDPDLQEGLDNLITNLPEGSTPEEKEEVVQPKFKVDRMDVTTLGFENLSLSFEDESSVLYGNRIVEILENSTGKVVAVLDKWDEGTLNYTINSYLSLKPNSAYTLNVTGQYKIEDTIYDRTFISKIFRTLDIGLDIVDDYKTDDSLSFAVYRNSYSEVNGFTYNISDKEGKIIVEDTVVEFNGLEKVIITEEEKFEPNTEYVLTIKNIKYGNDIFITVAYQELQLTYDTKTLKVNPFKNSEVELLGIVDSSKNTVAFSIDGINDINGGIVSYTYNIYNNDTSSQEGNEAIKTVTKNDSTALKIPFEELGVANGIDGNVYFNVSVNFDDNEKTIVYMSSNSQPITLSGTPYPTVVDYVKSENNKSSEILEGNIIIDDVYNFMEINNISYYKIDIKEKNDSTLGGTEQYIDTVNIETPNEGISRYTLPVHFEGLRPDSEYILYVYLLHNGKYIYLGYDIAKTATPEPIYLNVSFPEENLDGVSIFDFEISKNLNKESISFNSLKYLNFDLYRSSNIDSTENRSWEKIDFDTTIPENQDSQELIDLAFKNGKIGVTASDFEFYPNNYENIYNYKVVVTGFAQGYEIPVKINDSDTNEFPVVLNKIEPHLSIVAKHKVLNSESGQKKENLADDTIVGINFEIQTVENPMGQKITEITYNIYEADTYDEKTNTCTPKMENDQLIPIVTEDSLKLTTKNQKESIEFVSQDTAGLHRGVHYCMAYSGRYDDGDGDDNKVEIKEKNLHFMAEKQSVQIRGYIKNYDGKDLTLNLDIEDPDNSLVRNSTNPLIPNIKLYKSSPAEEIFVDNVSGNDYRFNDLSSKNYSLNITENVGHGEVLHSIYDVMLDDIVKKDNINVIVDTRSPGKIILKIPYGECNPEFTENGKCVINDLNEITLDRISGLGISNGTTISAFDLEKTDGYLYSEINLSDIKFYGSINNENQLTLNKIYVLYDSGKIIDYTENKSFFIKLRNHELNINYFNKKEDTFNYISKNSVFDNSDLSYDTTYDRYNINGTDSSLKFNIFNSSIENSSIGMLLNKSGNLSKTIHFNEVAKTNEAKLYDSDYNESSSFLVSNILSTDELKTVYTSTGANVSFKIVNSDIANGTQLKVVLSNNDEALVTCTRSGQICNWSTYSSTNTKIKKISVDNNNEVTVLFDNINDASYTYSIEFEFPDTNYYTYTYNNVNKKDNKDIIITSLNRLYLVNHSANIDKKYWHWTDENLKNDLQFIKQINYSFTVDTNKYKLENDEKIVYRIFAKNKDDETKSKYIVGNADSYIDLLENNTENINLYENALAAGTYEIILQSVLLYVYDSKTQEKNLEEFVLNNSLIITMNSPTFDIIKKADPIFNITMNDDDGMLTACTEENAKDLLDYLAESKVMKYVTTDSKNYYRDNNGKKVVYFEMYSKDSNGIETLRGYSPVPFVSKSANLDLTQFFIDRKLSTGDYVFKVSYCENSEVKRLYLRDFYILNASSLNMNLITMTDSYILMFSNPDGKTKDSIKRIKYQYTTANGSVVKELNNLDDDINNNNNIVYTANIFSNDITNYFLGLSVDGTLTSKITDLRIDFYSGTSDDTLITTYTKE